MFSFRIVLVAFALLAFAHADAQSLIVNLRNGEQEVLENFQRIEFKTVEDDHASVDLALPSGTIWATMNVGAEQPEGYGDYFSWGETAPKSSYYADDYQWCDNGQADMCLKYNTRNDCGTVDNLVELESADDPATVLWGAGWCTPSEEQFRELINADYTMMSLENINDVNVMQITSRKNGRVLLLPAAGYKWGTSIYYDGSRGNYWTRTLDADQPWYATDFNYYDGGAAFFGCYRYYGLTIRPVRR